MRSTLNKVDTIIIGAGPSGLSAANTLQKNGKKILILEKESVPGGKCHTFSDPENKNNKTEWGAALLASNYGNVIDKVEEKKLLWESTLKSDVTSLPFIQKYNRMSALQKTLYSIEYLHQMKKLSKYAKKYQRLRDKHQDLPDDFKLPFSEFAQKHDMKHINDFLYLIVSAFGYGLMEKCPTYSVLEYLGMTTLLDLTLGMVVDNHGFLSIKNGFQGLMEAIASDFDIKFNSVVESIERSKEGVVVTFRSGNEYYSVAADSLVLAISPLYWSNLGLQLTETEKKCIEHLSYYQYPVAVVKLKGYPAKHYFEYTGLIESGLGHLALITTRDNRIDPQDGRLCTAYINLKEKHVTKEVVDNFEFTPEKIQQLREELLRIPDVTDVQILETKVWQDYMSTLPWEMRMELDKQQMSNGVNTLYVGPYTLGGFEDVACVWEQADKAVLEFCFKAKLSHDIHYYSDKLHQVTFFHRTRHLPPFAGEDELKNSEVKRLKYD